MTKEETQAELAEKIASQFVDGVATISFSDLEIEPGDFNMTEVLESVLSSYTNKCAVKNETILNKKGVLEGKIVIVKMN